MATEYGVQTNNIFDLLNERPNATPPKKKEKVAAPAAKPKGPGSAAKGKATPAPAKAPQQQPKRANNAPRTGGSQAFVSSPVTDRPVGGKGFGERRRFDKDRKFDENRPHRGRVFDRKSGTGRSPVENKKGGSGKANWGSPVKSEIEALQEGAEQVDTKEATQEPKAEGAEGEAQVDANKGQGGEEEEAEEKTLTLEEYQELQKQKLAKVKLPKTRKAGEGVQPDSKWAEATPLTKKGADEEENIVPLGKKAAPAKPKKSGKGKKKEPTTNASDLLGFTTAEPRRGGGGGRGREGGRGGRGARGGRGGPRGGSGAGSSRGGGGGRRFEQSAPQFDDQRSFPALGKAE
ncbi:putative Telomere and ribosome associated protein Stm1 [Balamuthia mandrillaris]